MRDGMNHEELTALLSPAEGLDPAQKLFSSPPIESLEWLKELGDIARASLMPAEAPVIPAETASPEVTVNTAPTTLEKTPEKSSDARLLDALLEYHRLRGPTLGARTAQKSTELHARVDSSKVATRESGFNSMEIPVIQDYVPKTSASPHRASQPVHTVLKSKPRP